jgi:hypothetical protein
MAKKNISLIFFECTVITAICRMIIKDGSTEMMYYVIALIICFIFWYGFFELTKK